MRVLLRIKAMKLIIKQLELVVYVKMKRIEIAFYKTGGLCKDCCSQNFHVLCGKKNVFNRSSFNKHRKSAHNNQSLISSHT